MIQLHAFSPFVRCDSLHHDARFPSSCFLDSGVFKIRFVISDSGAFKACFVILTKPPLPFFVNAVQPHCHRDVVCFCAVCIRGLFRIARPFTFPNSSHDLFQAMLEPQYPVLIRVRDTSSPAYLLNSVVSFTLTIIRL